MSPRLLHYSDVENAYDTPERVARVAGLLADRRGPDALVAGSGDDTGPGVLSLVTDGRQSLEFFEAVDPHVETVGNHDFDHGFDALRSIVADSPQQWTLANVALDGERFGAEVGIKSGVLVDLADATVGVVGVLDPATTEMTPGTDALDFEDPVDAVARTEPRLREAGADRVVALAHTNDDDARAIAADTGVDAVLAGHSHHQHATAIDGTPFTRPGATGGYVYEVDLDTGDVTCHDTATAEPDPAVAAALRERVAANDLDEVVAHVEEPLSRDRERRLGGEWRLGNFVADAYRWKTGADVALQNGGGIREGPPLSGDVTVADLISVSPFEEPVVVASVTGRELRSVVAEADGRAVDGLNDYWYGHVSGMRVAAENGGYEPYVGGDPVEPDERYTVAVPNYVLITDLEFPTLTEAHAVERYDLQYEVVVEYARESGVDPRLEGRIPDAVAAE
ncbi:bifunctional metallophosphatase/5'-nucleotidase [Halosimplex pelagicum]|uniref:5'-nucleotidase C-terminal domain-containing protein n=1 Tax=Halosimplex pelagicum TaxID=869886 RepID=A0A7D5P8N5_9EURY|nr:5'-nucleotidase C-terminal domain-containing protein [Halosimplex pelagicum]QLH83483.1 5'-nucleotidase C-terminal domain-containing protein [Halosimplex pelagicum]